MVYRRALSMAVVAGKFTQAFPSSCVVPPSTLHTPAVSNSTVFADPFRTPCDIKRKFLSKSIGIRLPLLLTGGSSAGHSFGAFRALFHNADFVQFSWHCISPSAKQHSLQHLHLQPGVANLKHIPLANSRTFCGASFRSPLLGLTGSTLGGGESRPDINIFQGTEMGGKTTPVRDTVELTEMEERIFDVLTSTLKHFNLHTQLRVAGGWVRDKLIGKTSVDIDIALDNMLGVDFCKKINEFLALKGEKTHSIGLIQSNPDQSKHLETANMQVLDMRIDFVNLRAEKYAENSRIPEMVFGSPEQDADRRDLTINSMFYNINTRTVEDLTSRGISDLKAGIIRTPLPPESTFLDDPLRVLRAIRFGARFDFTLDDDLKKAAASETVRVALLKKVSRDRIGHEAILMLTGNRPDKAMRHLEELSLFSTVFLVPDDMEPDPSIPANYGRSCVNALQAVTRVLASLGNAAEIQSEQLRLLMLGSIFLPLRDYCCFSDKKKKKQVPVSTYIIRDSMKLRNQDFTGVETLHNAAVTFQEMMKRLLQPGVVDSADAEDRLRPGDSYSPDLADIRVDLGLLLRKSKELWFGGLVLASILDIPSVDLLAAEDKGCSDNLINEKVDMCTTVTDIVAKLGLAEVWKLKPLLGGKEIMAILKLQPGEHMQERTERVLRWQLAHPRATVEDCKSWLEEDNVKRLKTA